VLVIPYTARDQEADSRLFRDVVFAAVMLEVDAIMHSHLVAQSWAFDRVRPDVIGQVPDEQVGVLEVLLGPFLELVKKLEHAVMIVEMISAVVMVAGCGAQEDVLMVADLAVD